MEELVPIFSKSESDDDPTIRRYMVSDQTWLKTFVWGEQQSAQSVR